MISFWLVFFCVAVILGLLVWAIIRVGDLADRAAEGDLIARDHKAYRTTREAIDDEVVADDPATARRLLAERAAARQRDL